MADDRDPTPIAPGAPRPARRRPRASRVAIVLMALIALLTGGYWLLMRDTSPNVRRNEIATAAHTAERAADRPGPPAADGAAP